MADDIPIPSTLPTGGDVRGKRVVLTGAGRGLGRLLAHAFSRAGASVALVARTEADLEAVAAELPGPSVVHVGDVTDASCNDAVADAAVAEWAASTSGSATPGSPRSWPDRWAPTPRCGARCSR